MFNPIGNIFAGGLSLGGFGDLGFIGGASGFFGGFGMCVSPSHCIWNGASSVGHIVGGPFGYRGLGYAGPMMDYILGSQRRRQRADERIMLPGGTDSRYSDERGVNYMRQYLNGKGLPKQSDVIRNVLGAPPKRENFASKSDFENARIQYARAKEDLKKKDDVLRNVTEKIIGGWTKDPEKMAAFARRWDNAATEEDLIWALLDPKGDGVKALIQQLQGSIPELAGVQDESKAMEIITAWFRDNFSDLMVGRNILVTMGAELRGRFVTGSASALPPVESRDQHISKLKEKGYTDEEAKQILSGVTSEWEADTIVESMTTDQTRNTQTIDSYKEKLNEIENTKVDKKDEKEKEEKIKYLKEQLAKAERDRAEAYARDFARAARILYGARPDLVLSPPTEIKTAPEAIHWAYDQVGVNSDEAPPPPKVEEAKKEEPKKAGGGGPKAPPSNPGAKQDPNKKGSKPQKSTS